MLSSLPHSLAAVASSCKGVPTSPRASHTKLSFSQVQLGEQWTTAYAVHKKPQQRRVARRKLRPSGTDAVFAVARRCRYWRSRSREGFSSHTDSFRSDVCGTKWVQNTDLQRVSGLFLPEVSLPLLLQYENEAVIAHMCSSVERFPSSHDKNRWKSLISISFGHAGRGTKLQGP